MANFPAFIEALSFPSPSLLIFGVINLHDFCPFLVLLKKLPLATILFLTNNHCQNTGK
jgi:hypothetical protein